MGYFYLALSLGEIYYPPRLHRRYSRSLLNKIRSLFSSVILWHGAIQPGKLKKMSRLLLQNKEKTQCLLCKSKRQLYKRKRNPNKRARDRLLRKNSHSKCKRNLLNTPFMRMLITNLESLCRNMSISKKYRIKSYPSREKTSRSL